MHGALHFLELTVLTIQSLSHNMLNGSTTLASILYSLIGQTNSMQIYNVLLDRQTSYPWKRLR